MGRPLNKKYFGNRNTPPIGGEGVASVTVGGTNNNYTAIPTFTFAAPNLNDGVNAVGTVATMVAKTATVATSGTGTVADDYEPGDVLTVVGGTGTAATFTVSSVTVRTVVAQAAGTTVWTTGDTVTFSSGWDTPAILTITDDGGGGIASLTITQAGVHSGTIPTDPVSPDSATVADGGGYQSDATFNLGFGVNAVAIATAGSYTALPSNPVATTTDSANGTGATLNVNYGIGTITVSTAGSGYTSAPAITLSGGNGSLTAVLASTNENSISMLAFLTGGSAQVSDIVKQVSTDRYKVSNSDGEGIVQLQPSAANAEGECSIEATDSAGGTYYVTKLTAHRAQITAGTGTQFVTGSSVPWTLGTAVINETIKLPNA